MSLSRFFHGLEEFGGLLIHSMSINSMTKKGMFTYLSSS